MNNQSFFSELQTHLFNPFVQGTFTLPDKHHQLGVF